VVQITRPNALKCLVWSLLGNNKNTDIPKIGTQHFSFLSFFNFPVNRNILYSRHYLFKLSTS